MSSRILSSSHALRTTILVAALSLLASDSYSQVDATDEVIRVPDGVLDVNGFVIMPGRVDKTSVIDDRKYIARVDSAGYLSVTRGSQELQPVSRIPLDVVKRMVRHQDLVTDRPQTSSFEARIDEWGIWTRGEQLITIGQLVLWLLACVGLLAIGMLVNLQYRSYWRARRHMSILKGQFQAREAERARLAAELHDGPVQELQYLLRSYFGRVVNAESAGNEKADIRGVLENICSGLRRVCTELRPPTLQHFGLAASIRACASSFEARYDNVDIDVAVLGTDKQIPSEIELTLYRILQEALNNVAKHAGPCEVFVELAIDESWIELTIRDTGVGCVLPKLELLEQEGHLGLSGIAHRAKTVGAAAEIRSQPGDGTLVRVVARLPEAALPLPTRKAVVRTT